MPKCPNCGHEIPYTIPPILRKREAEPDYSLCLDGLCCDLLCGTPWLCKHQIEGWKKSHPDDDFDATNFKEEMMDLIKSRPILKSFYDKSSDEDVEYLATHPGADVKPA
jgi:hypothetical protein